MKTRILASAVSCAACCGATTLLIASTEAARQQPAKPPATAPASAPASPTAPAPKRIEIDPADAKWLDRIPKEDRAAVDEMLGWAPPAFASELEWLGSEPLTWESLRGRVVVVQSFTTGTTAGRGWPQRIANALKVYPAKDLRIIALHTPEKADEAKEFLARRAAPEGVAVAIDPKGEFCDSLCVYRQPMNIVIDRNGVVRYAALNMRGVEEAVKALVAEPFNQNLVVAPRPGESSAFSTSDAPEFPPITGKVDNALDIRGKRAPEFFVGEWLTDRPNAEGKVVVLDFWATWCGPCVATIPHMNDLATRFRDDVVCVGISDEPRFKFEQGMKGLERDRKITMETFQYPLALDPSAKMKNAISNKSIPHCLVMDRNWIVRWQGHPAALDAGTLDRIVKADRAQAQGDGGTGGGGRSKPGARRKTWTGG